MSTCYLNFAGNANEELVCGLLRDGEMTVEIVYDSECHSFMADLIGQTAKIFTLVFRGEAEWTFTAFVTSFEPSNPFGGTATALVTLKLAVEPTLEESKKSNSVSPSTFARVLSIQGSAIRVDDWYINDLEPTADTTDFIVDGKCEYCGQTKTSKYGACVGCGIPIAA